MKKILITGGSRGIGEACVRRFAAAGERVVFTYNKNASAAKKISRETGAAAIQLDVTDRHAVNDAVGRAVELLGGIDVLVNNAGIAQIKLFTDLGDDEWEKMISTNLSGAFYTSRAAAAHMILGHYGRIINIGSVWGNHGASCEVHYSAAKSGLRGFTRALAKELGPSGITVNCIEPGVIDTDMNSGLGDEILRELIDATPLCRLGSPGDVAAAVAFLASDDASFITGQCIGIDGGFAL